MPALTTFLAIGGGLAAGASAGSAYLEGKRADRTARLAEETTREQRELARESWQRYLDTFAPLEDQIVEEAALPVEEQPGFARMLSDIDRGYADIGANVRRTLGGRYQHGAGVERASQESIERGRISARAKGIGDFIKSRFAKMLDAASIGRGLPATATSAFGSAGPQLQNLAQMHSTASAKGWGSAGSTLGNLMSLYAT